MARIPAKYEELTRVWLISSVDSDLLSDSKSMIDELINETEFSYNEVIEFLDKYDQELADLSMELPDIESLVDNFLEGYFE